MIERMRESRYWPPIYQLELRVRVADKLIGLGRRILPVEMERELFDDWDPPGTPPRVIEFGGAEITKWERSVSETVAESIREQYDSSQRGLVAFEGNHGAEFVDGVYRHVINPWGRVTIQLPMRDLTYTPPIRRGQLVRFSSTNPGTRTFDGFVLKVEGAWVIIDGIFAAAIHHIEGKQITGTVLDKPYIPQEITDVLASEVK